MNHPLHVDRAFLDEAAAAVRDNLSGKISSLNSVSPQRTSLALSGPILEFVELQVLIPIVVSLISSALYDVFKKKILKLKSPGALKKALGELSLKSNEIREALTPEARDKLQAELIPLGFTDEDIETLFEQVRVIAQRHAAEQAVARQDTGTAVKPDSE